MRFLPIALLFCLPFWGKAQNFWVKSYLGGGFAPRHVLIENFGSVDVYIAQRNKPQLLWMLALERQMKKGNLIEISVGFRTKQTAHNYRNLILSPNSEPESVDVGTTKQLAMDLNLEYSMLIVNNIVDKLDAYCSFILNTGYSAFEFGPKRSTMFPRASEVYWGNLGIAPRAQLGIGNRWKLDVNIALFLLNLTYESDSVRNPALSASQQSSSLLAFNFGQKLWLRLGLGYCI